MNSIILTESHLISAELLELLRTASFLMPNWKWIALAVTLTLAFGLNVFLRMILGRLRRSQLMTQKRDVGGHLERNRFLGHLAELNIEKSISIVLTTALWQSLIEELDTPPSLAKYLFLGARLLTAYNVIRLTYLGVDALGKVLEDFAAKTESTIDDQLAPIATKSLKVLVIIVGVLIVLQNFGVNVTALLAGLGIGGVAIAFAAQDTVANLFGTITILLDAPFKLGDQVKIGDTEGVIEEVGFRSTRVRTPYNSVIVLPNSVVAKEKIDNMTERTHSRLRHNLGLHYDTSPAKVNEFCEAVRYILMQFPQVDRERIVVAFNGYMDSTLNILINAHLKVKDYNEEVSVQDRILIEILKMSKSIGVEFAYPTRTLVFENSSGGPALPSQN